MVSQPRADEFLPHYSGCESWLFAYLVTLLGNRDDAEEVFQETTLALWRSFDDFQPGTDFARWAKRVAFHRVLTYRKQRQRQGVPQSEEFFSAVHAADERCENLAAARGRALDDCVARLPEADQRLVSLKYTSKATIPQLATQLGRSPNTVAKALKRIRRLLMGCVERTLIREGHV